MWPAAQNADEPQELTKELIKSEPAKSRMRVWMLHRLGASI
jgi:hypothetical protein